MLGAFGKVTLYPTAASAIDANDLTQTGLYGVSSAAAAASSNIPNTLGCRFVVFNIWGTIMQFCASGSKSAEKKLHFRILWDTGQTWTDWVLLA